MSQNLPETISNLIASQFPDVYRKDGPNLVAFLEAYYQWLESSDNPLYQSRKLQEYSDIDKTLEDFIIYFKDTYLSGIQFDTLSNKRLTVKKIVDLYRSKGNTRALKLLFQLVFKEDIEVYLPSSDILKPSNGDWEHSVYLEVSKSSRYEEYLGKTITGVNSGATAFVDHIVKKKINSKNVIVYYITNISKDFLTGEMLKVSSDLTDAPVVIGSLSSLTIDEPGYSFAVGDLVDIISNNGRQAVGLVSEISSITGAIKFILNEVPSGWGFSLEEAEPLVSEAVIAFANVANVSSGNVFLNKFDIITLNDPSNNASNVYANAMAWAYSTNTSGTLGLLDLSSNQHLVSVTVTGANSGYSNTDIIRVKGGTSTGKASITTNSTGGFTNSNISIINAGVYGKTKANNDLTIEVYAANGELSTGNTGTFSAGVALNPDLTNAHTMVYSSTGQASVNTIYSGIDASFKLNSILASETIFLWNDFLSGLNNDGDAYMDLRLNANTYGFPKNPAANGSSVDRLIAIFDYSLKDLGEVESITTQNPGKNYNIVPFVELFESNVYAKKKRDYVIETTPVSGRVRVGEEITQEIPYGENVVSLVVNTSANSFEYFEEVYQANSSANVATGGVFSVSGNTLYINTYTGTFNTSNDITGTVSNVTAEVVSLANSGLTGLAIGRVSSVSDNTLYVKRMSLANDFEDGLNIVGKLSGSVVNVVSVAEDISSEFSGDNADIAANVVSASGAVRTLDIQDSGFGYIQDELVTFISQKDSTKIGTAKVQLINQGHGSGYYSSTNGFLSANKYIQDGIYFQEFSYEIQSSLDLSKYADMVREVVHVSGTKMFGSIYKNSDLPTSLNIEACTPSIG